MSLRSALDNLINTLPEEVVKVKHQVKTDYEITAYAELLSIHSPTLIFKKIKNYPNFTVISNVFSSRNKIATYLGVKQPNLNEKWVSIISRDNDYTVSNSDGPVREIRLLGENVDISTIPVPLHYPQDGGRYITSGIVIAKNTEEKVNLSFARIQLVGKDKVALSMHSRGHLWSYYLKSRELKRDLPISIIIGAHPIYYLMAAARIEDEYRKIHGLIDDYLISGITNDLPVSANSEIVLEGKIYWDKFYDEGPFTEYTGYLSNRSTRNLAKIDAIYMRREPIYLEINPSNSKEHVLLSGIAKEPMVESTIRDFLPSAYRFTVDWPLKGVHYVAMAQLDNPDRGIAMQLGLMLLGLDHYLKIVFVAENAAQLGLYNMLSLFLCSGRYEIIRDVFCNKLDPSASPEGTSSKVIFTCNGPNEQIKIEEHEDGISISRCGKRLHVGHEMDDGASINLIIDSDIDAKNEEEVLWALATRLQPAEGIKASSKRITIDARRAGLSRPSIPEEVVKKVKQYIQKASAPL